MVAPRGADRQPLLPEKVWRDLQPAAQAVIVALAQQVAALSARVRELEARVGQNSSNWSRPPSSDWPGAGLATRVPPTGPSGRRAGG